MPIFSYSRIVGAVTWRSLVLVSSLGAIYGTVVSPIAGTVAGGLLGGSVGLSVGVASGLYLSGVTWLCRPVHLNKRFVVFSSISIALLTCIGTGFYLGLYFNSYPLSLTIFRAALIAGFACAWIGRQVALSIISGEREHQMQLPST